MTRPTAYLCCDWGTTRLRVRAVRADDFSVIAEHRSLDGVARLAERSTPAQRAQRFQSTLARCIEALSTDCGDLVAEAPIAISGMASSSIGWQELPYARLPMPLDGSGLAWRDVGPLALDGTRHRVVLVSGARTDADVMRGEETEVVGLFSLRQMRRFSARSLIIKPGTHSKHLQVAGEQLVDFATFMTGELFDVLTRHSILRYSTEAGDSPESTAMDPDDLRAGVRAAHATPLTAALFRLRTRQLIDGMPGQRNRTYLTGLLLGSELGYLANSPELAGVPLLLVATNPLEAHYRTALEELGLGSRLTCVPPEQVELLSARGQAALLARLAQ